MKEVEFLEELEVGDFVLLKDKDGNNAIVVKLDTEESELKGRIVKSQYPNSGNLEYLSERDWNERFFHKYKVSGSCDWGKEYTEI